MKIVIVGAGRGLGHVLAQMLAEKGHTVVAGLRRLDDTISERENLIYLQMDATDEGQIRDAVQWTKHHVGEIDAVVYVAGILLQSDRTETLLTESLDDIRKQIEVNALGLITVFRDFLPVIKKSGHQKEAALRMKVACSRHMGFLRQLPIKSFRHCG